MLRNVRKNAIQPDMTKISFTGYTSQADSPTILVFGPFGSCRIPTAELSGWRFSHSFAVAGESVLRVRTTPQQGSGSRSSPEIVPVRHPVACVPREVSGATFIALQILCDYYTLRNGPAMPRMKFRKHRCT